MNQYEVIGSDGDTVGHVVGQEGDLIIVERGHLRKHRYALPQTFVEVDDEAKVVRTTLSKQLIEGSPEVHHDDGIDQKEIAAYYGLAGGWEQPDTLGYGITDPNDPAVGADAQTRRAGLIPPEEKRARMREGEDDVYGPPGRQLIPPDAHEDVPGRKR
jgi:hypothetical protein